MNYQKYTIPVVVVLTSLGLNVHSFLQGQETPIGDADPKKTVSETDSESEFLRIRRDAEGNPLALQTAIVRYRNKNRTVLVDLIGAVHIGESDYYKQLNFQFDQYESLLYELVAPEGTRVPAKGEQQSRSTNPISFLQSSAQSMLGLESQLEMVDYQKDNFVHADLSPADLQEKMAERGENTLTLGLSAIADMLREQNRNRKNAEQAELSSLKSESLFEVIGNPLKMKLMMAEQFASSGALDAGLGPKLNQLIVTDRNIAAMKVLQREIVKGKTKLGLFYGAAHMPDFEKRLFDELGLEKSEHVWVDAWDLTQANGKQGGGGAASLMMKLLESLEDE